MNHRLLHTIREACEKQNVSPTSILLIASVAHQRLTVLNRKREWSFSEEQQIVISTSRFGVGQESGSEKTPLGLHRIAEKFGEKPEVLNAIGAHHDEIEMTTLISPIVQVCDAVSGARPGARREIVEAYIKRIKELEGMAMSFDGVSSAYAIQAGRELRVMVESEKVSDAKADELAFLISEKIQTEMTYPGQVRITVIREKRAVSYAK